MCNSVICIGEVNRCPICEALEEAKKEGKISKENYEKMIAKEVNFPEQRRITMDDNLLQRTADAMKEWYDRCAHDLFADEMDGYDGSITYSGQELADMAADYLPYPLADWYSSLSTKERAVVVKKAFPCELYGY